MPQPAKGEEVPDKPNSLMKLLEGNYSVTVKGDITTVIRCAYRDTLPQSKLRDFGASILLDWIANRKYDFQVGHSWINLVHEVKDLSTDIVRIQMTKPKPFVLKLNWSNFLMKSSYTNYEIRNIG
ncbi:MAG: hypothetical protein Q9210_006692 [Variospora velana]